MIETKEDGTPRKVGLELLNPGRRLADKQGGKAGGAAGSAAGQRLPVQASGEYGADEIIVVDSEEFKEYSTDAYTAALTFLIEKYGPTTMLIGATPTGRDWAPGFPAFKKTGLTADCTSLDVDAETGNMAWTRPAFGGNLMATILCPDCRPQLGTVRPGVFKSRKQGFPGLIIKEEYSFPKEKIRTTVLEIIREAASEVVDLEGAEIIVSGGRGLGGPDGFKLMRTLADVLGNRGLPGRQWMRAGSAYLPSGGTDRQDRCPKDLHCLRHFRRHPAHGGHERG